MAPHAHRIVTDLTADGTLPGMAERALADCSARFAVAGLSTGGYVARGGQWADPAGLVPGAVLHILPGAGHLPPPEQPAATSALLLQWFSATLAGLRRPGLA